jgi:branched-chain amino acid transport system permease protein
MLGWHLSAMLLVIVVLGGMRGVTGPLVGAVALLGFEEVLKSVTEYWKLVEGLVIIVLVFALPGGLRQLASMVLGPRAEAPAAEPALPAAGEASRA